MHQPEGSGRFAAYLARELGSDYRLIAPELPDAAILKQLTAHLLRGHCVVDQRREERAPQAAAEAADLIVGASGMHLPKWGST
jgi:hypothetical protein